MSAAHVEWLMTRIYMYACMHACTCSNIRKQEWNNLFMFTFTWMCPNFNGHLHGVYACTHADMYTYIYIYIYVIFHQSSSSWCILAHMKIYIYIYIYIHKCP